jgi:hypothetical protein
MNALAYFTATVAASIAGSFAFLGIQAIAQGSPLVGIT